MAQRRMINKKISLSEKVADLPLLGQLLYTWMIPHADDLGLLQASARTIKGAVFPIHDVLVKDVEEMLNKMEDAELIRRVTQNKKAYFYIEGFEKNQNLRRDRQPFTILEFKLGKNAKESWKKLEKVAMDVIGIQLVDQADTDDIPVTANRLVKSSIVKLSKVKNSVSKEETDNGFLTYLPDLGLEEDYVEWVVDDVILKQLKDEHSRKFYILAVKKIPEHILREYLHELKQEPGKDPPKIFTSKVMKYAEEKYSKLMQMS